MGHKLDKVGGKAKKSLSSLKLNKDKKNLDSVPEGRELGGLDNLNLDPGVNSDEEEDIDQIFKVFLWFYGWARPGVDKVRPKSSSVVAHRVLLSNWDFVGVGD